MEREVLHKRIIPWRFWAEANKQGNPYEHPIFKREFAMGLALLEKKHEPLVVRHLRYEINNGVGDGMPPGHEDPKWNLMSVEIEFYVEFGA